jgi:ring-1,2-phenylacetyl-CoA epoxidase subunit PaaE
MTRFHSLKIQDIRRETRDSVSISFAVPDDLKSQFSFIPGQYLTLRASIAGEDIRRSYSICSGLDDQELRIGIKKVAGGAFSTFSNDTLKPGDSLSVMPPDGRFKLAPDQTGRHVLGVAAGSGITPILSIIRSILAREPMSRTTLIYGNQTSHSVMFGEEIEDLKNRHIGRLAVFHILSRESQDVELLSGRINQDKLKLLAAGAVDFSSVSEAFLCGPQAMVQDITSALPSLGIATTRIHSELFSAAKPRKNHDAERVIPVIDKMVSSISVVLDGKRHSFAFLNSDTSLIDAAARNGVELPYSCKGGMCCTCRCKVEKGEAEMAVNYSLEEWEMKAGFILSCQAKPRTPELALDFDQL